MFALRLATDQMCAQRQHAAAQVLLKSIRRQGGRRLCQRQPQGELAIPTDVAINEVLQRSVPSALED